MITVPNPASGPAAADRCKGMVAAPPLAPPTTVWPPKFDVLGTEVTASNYDELTTLFVAAAKRGEPAVGTFTAVHPIVTAHGDAQYRYKLNAFDVVAPDGQPVRWALNKLHRANLTDRVYGPEIMMRVCGRCAAEGVSIYLYGASGSTLTALRRTLLERHPTLVIAAMESPPFRPLSDEENQAAVDRINASGAGIVFIGLGVPRQDEFAYRNRRLIRPVQLCVGAAFDFHAGNKKMAPAWMQKRGLEWAFRLYSEPGRLWKRYLLTNSAFVGLMARRIVRGR